MTLANPGINSVTSNYDGSTTQVLVLFNNSGGFGYIRMKVLQGAVEKVSRKECVGIILSPLHSKWSLLFSGPAPIDYVDAYRCNADDPNQNCSVTPPTCTNEVLTSRLTLGGLYPIAYNPTSPSTPVMTITPGDKQLVIAWNQISDPSGLSEVFAYFLRVYKAGTIVVGGHIPAGIRSIVVSNLTNGVAYDIDLWAVSHSNEMNAPRAGSGTPVAPACPVPACNFAVG